LEAVLQKLRQKRMGSGQKDDVRHAILNTIRSRFACLTLSSSQFFDPDLPLRASFERSVIVESHVD
jgi:hypothetical protein